MSNKLLATPPFDVEGERDRKSSNRHTCKFLSTYWQALKNNFLVKIVKIVVVVVILINHFVYDRKNNDHCPKDS